MTLHDSLLLALEAAAAGLSRVPRDSESAAAAAVARVRRAVADGYRLRPDPYRPPPDPVTDRLVEIARGGSADAE